MDDSTEASAATPTDDGHLAKPAPSQEEPKRKRLVAVPGPVVELLQAEIDLHNAAMARWSKKLRAAATLSGVPEDADYNFKQSQDGSFVFIVEDA